MRFYQRQAGKTGAVVEAELRAKRETSDAQRYVFRVLMVESLIISSWLRGAEGRHASTFGCSAQKLNISPQTGKYSIITHQCKDSIHPCADLICTLNTPTYMHMRGHVNVHLDIITSGNTARSRCSAGVSAFMRICTYCGADSRSIGLGSSPP